MKKLNILLAIIFTVLLFNNNTLEGMRNTVVAQCDIHTSPLVNELTKKVEAKYRNMREILIHGMNIHKIIDKRLANPDDHSLSKKLEKIILNLYNSDTPEEKRLIKKHFALLIYPIRLKSLVSVLSNILTAREERISKGFIRLLHLDAQNPKGYFSLKGIFSLINSTSLMLKIEENEIKEKLCTTIINDHIAERVDRECGICFVKFGKLNHAYQIIVRDETAVYIYSGCRLRAYCTDCLARCPSCPICLQGENGDYLNQQ